MADVVEFRCSSHKRRAFEASRAKSGEIVIFPGIRYERAPQDSASEEPKAPVSKKARKKRDTLELIDA
jgi:hypothetical protein